MRLNQQGNIKEKWVIGILGVLVICLLTINLTNTKGKAVESNSIVVDQNAKKGGLESQSKEEIQADLNKKVAESMINISMNMHPIFKDGDSEGNLMIVNEEINNYMQVIEIYIADTNELIYKSGGIPVGSKIESAKLDTPLPKGSYRCKAYFNAVNETTGEYVGKAVAEIEISVQN